MRAVVALFFVSYSMGYAQEGAICVNCVSQQTAKTKIEYKPTELLACHPGAQDEEVAALKAAQGAKITAVEMLGRLILSESMSTGFWSGRCQSPKGSQGLLEGIGWGIANRILPQLKKLSIENAVENEVFKPKNFRTSFTSKKQNPFAEIFLCPAKSNGYLVQNHHDLKVTGDLYGKSLLVAENIYETLKSGRPIPVEYQKVTNFFYPHSEIFGEVRPSWAKEPPSQANPKYLNIMGYKDPCVEFYHL
jgi:hypothetical protein